MTLTEGERGPWQDMVDFMLGNTTSFERRVRVVRLGKYNAEIERGIQHTPEWDEYMRQEQKWFDDDK